MNAVHLETIVPPPAAPTAADGDFSAVERQLGTSLPSDWKQVIRRYGHGTFGDFFHLWSPFFEPCPMASEVARVLGADRQLAAALPGAVPFALHPDPDGALPWANTDNGDVAYWITRGSPDDWPAAVWNARSAREHDLVAGGASALITRWMAGERLSQSLPHDVPRCFDPWRERAHFTVELTGTAKPFAERLRALVDALAPVEMRGSFGDESDEARQVHFVCRGGAWRFTYDTVYGHNVRVAVPPQDLGEAKSRIRDATFSMGCGVSSAL